MSAPEDAAALRDVEAVHLDDDQDQAEQAPTNSYNKPSISVSRLLRPSGLRVVLLCAVSAILGAVAYSAAFAPSPDNNSAPTGHRVLRTSQDTHTHTLEIVAEGGLTLTFADITPHSSTVGNSTSDVDVLFDARVVTLDGQLVDGKALLTFSSSGSINGLVVIGATTFEIHTGTALMGDGPMEIVEWEDLDVPDGDVDVEAESDPARRLAGSDRYPRIGLMRDTSIAYDTLNPVFLAWYINNYNRRANLACLDFFFDRFDRSIWWASSGNQNQALNVIANTRRTADFVLLFHATGGRTWPRTNDFWFTDAEGCPCNDNGGRVHDNHKVAIVAHQGSMQRNVQQALRAIGRMRDSQQTFRYDDEPLFSHAEWARMVRCDRKCRWDRRAC